MSNITHYQNESILLIPVAVHMWTLLHVFIYEYIYIGLIVAIAAIDMNGVCGFLVLITSSLAAVQRFALKCSVPVLHAKPRLMVSIMGPIECGARSPTNWYALWPIVLNKILLILLSHSSIIHSTLLGQHDHEPKPKVACNKPRCLIVFQTSIEYFRLIARQESNLPCERMMMCNIAAAAAAATAFNRSPPFCYVHTHAKGHNCKSANLIIAWSSINTIQWERRGQTIWPISMHFKI